MTKDEAVQKLAKVARISVAYAEDLYDSFFQKPVIPYYIADYLEKVKSDGDLTVVGAVKRSTRFIAEPEEPTYDSISELITKVNQWADDRNLKQADPKIQWMRVTEEVGEIRDVLLKPTKFTEPQAALKDAIGDTLVTIIVLAHQLDLDVTECLGIAYEEIKNRKGKMINGTFVKEEDL